MVLNFYVPRSGDNNILFSLSLPCSLCERVNQDRDYTLFRKAKRASSSEVFDSHVVVKIFVHRRKTEKNEQVGGVQRVHTHLYICVIRIR